MIGNYIKQILFNLEMGRVRLDLQQERLSTAIARILQARNRFPDYTELNHGYLADYFLAQGILRRGIQEESLELHDLHEIIRLLTASLNIKPDFDDAHLHLGLVLALKLQFLDSDYGKEAYDGIRAEASKHLSEAMNLNPNYSAYINSIEDLLE